MFSTKYNTTLLDSKWSVIKNNVKINVIPRKNEYVYYVDRYYHVVNVIHDLTTKHNVLIILEELTNDKQSDLGGTKK